MKTASKWLVLSLIVILGITMSAALTISARMESELLSETLPLQDAAIMVELELSRFHLMLEEYIFKYKTEGVEGKDILAHIKKAQWMGNAMLYGGEDEEWAYVPLEDKRLRDEIIAMNGELGEVHDLAGMMISQDPGWPAIDRLHSLLATAQLRVDDVENALHRTVRDKQDKNARMLAIILFMCGVFTVVTTGVTYNYISAALRARDELAEARSFLQDIMDGVDEPIMVIDTEYKVPLMNASAIKLYGEAKDARLWHCHELLHERDRPCTDTEWTCTLKEVMDKGHTIVQEHEHHGKDGEMHRLELVASPWRGGRGRINGVIVCARDVTERKRLERQRSDFYAMVTHDIKSPLTAITGYAEMILESKSKSLDPEMLEMLTMIRRSGEKLQRMVMDFLSVSQMEAGMLKVNLLPSDVAGLLRETCVEMEKVFNNKGLTFSMELTDDLPGLMMIDRQLVQRAVNNLLSNAGAYTPTGGTVALRTRCVSGKDEERVDIEVTDTGPGIPEHEQAKIFEKYYRLPGMQGVKGSGLGLAIVNIVAMAHGGRVELESEPGRGSTFRLCLPVRPFENHEPES